jgi:predicted branched-subunit amino acid permease
MLLGARLCLPAMPGSMVFAAAFGSVAAQKGLTFAEAILMSASVFAGISQLVAMEMWHDTWTVGSVAAVCLVTAIINMRMVLMSAALRPALEHCPPRVLYPFLQQLTEVNWIVYTRASAGGRNDLGILFGAGLALWASWTLATAPGYLLGALVHDPSAVGLDLVMPCFLTAMMIPLWKGHRQSLIWGASGAVALAVSFLVPGYWFIVAGALTGAFTGAALDD